MVRDAISGSALTNDSSRLAPMRVWPDEERYRGSACPGDRERLEAVIGSGNSPQKHVWRSRIVLLSADRVGTMTIQRETGKGKPTIWRWQARFMAEGVEALLHEATRPPGKPPLNPEDRLLACRPRNWGRSVSRVPRNVLSHIRRQQRAIRDATALAGRIDNGNGHQQRPASVLTRLQTYGRARLATCMTDIAVRAAGRIH